MNMTSQAQALPPARLEATAEFNNYPTQSNRGGPTINSWLGPAASFKPETFVNEVFDRQSLENIAWSGEDPSKHREQVDSFGAPQEATPNDHWHALPLPGPYSYLDVQEGYLTPLAMLDTQGDPFQLQYPADAFETENISNIAGPSQPPLGGSQEVAFDLNAQFQHDQLHYYDGMASQDQRYVTPSDVNSTGQYISNHFQMGDTGDLGYVNLSGEQVDKALQEPGIARAQRKRSIADVDHDMSSMQYTKQDGRANKRRRNSSGSSSHPSAQENFEESEPEEDDDSDVYQPSRSPSPRGANSRNSTRSRRANISAALALRAFGNQEERGALSDDGSVIITRRNNRSIPLPVPVPNLTKKSRGRKVPSLGTLRTSGSEDEGSVGPSHGRDERSYVCSVAGCGKCFFRGEHLKRHVRSIHTFDKPHVCPYEGCHKSFSRRDNLGQHLRIHL